MERKKTERAGRCFTMTFRLAGITGEPGGGEEGSRSPTYEHTRENIRTSSEGASRRSGRAAGSTVLELVRQQKAFSEGGRGVKGRVLVRRKVVVGSFLGHSTRDGGDEIIDVAR